MEKSDLRKESDMKNSNSAFDSKLPSLYSKEGDDRKEYEKEK